MCKSCFHEFKFTVEEQNFFAQKEFSIPKRCKHCRLARKNIHANPNKKFHRRMYEIMCAECGGKAWVPFEPIKRRPVYCKLCYNSQFAGNRSEVTRKAVVSKWYIKR